MSVWVIFGHIWACLHMNVTTLNTMRKLLLQSYKLILISILSAKQDIPFRFFEENHVLLYAHDDEWANCISRGRWGKMWLKAPGEANSWTWIKVCFFFQTTVYKVKNECLYPPKMQLHAQVFLNLRHRLQCPDCKTHNEVRNSGFHA